MESRAKFWWTCMWRTKMWEARSMENIAFWKFVIWNPVVTRAETGLSEQTSCSIRSVIKNTIKCTVGTVEIIFITSYFDSKLVRIASILVSEKAIVDHPFDRRCTIRWAQAWWQYCDIIYFNNELCYLRGLNWPQHLEYMSDLLSAFAESELSTLQSKSSYFLQYTIGHDIFPCSVPPICSQLAMVAAASADHCQRHRDRGLTRGEYNGRRPVLLPPRFPSLFMT